MFHGILEIKKGGQSYKKKEFKNTKNWDFSYGFSPLFWSKIGNFFRVFI